MPRVQPRYWQAAQRVSEASADGDRARIQLSNEELQTLGLPTSAEPFDFDNDPDTVPTTTNPEPFSENGLRKELGLLPRLQGRMHNR